MEGRDGGVECWREGVTDRRGDGGMGVDGRGDGRKG